MKKLMMVIAIVTALCFIVSMIAVAPSAAKAVSKGESKAKSVTPAQVPPHTPGESTVPKAQFWDLALDHCVLNGISISMNPCTSKTVTVKVGQPLAGTCFYKAITLPKANITKADAAYWGSGNFTYMIGYFIVNSLNAGKLFKKEETRNLPKFTYADLPKWTKGNRGVWTQIMQIHWVPTQEYIGSNFFWFKLDLNSTIDETDGSVINNYCTLDIQPPIINVTP